MQCLLVASTPPARWESDCCLFGYQYSRLTWSLTMALQAADRACSTVSYVRGILHHVFIQQQCNACSLLHTTITDSVHKGVRFKIHASWSSEVLRGAMAAAFIGQEIVTPDAGPADDVIAGSRCCRRLQTPAAGFLGSVA